MKNKSIKWLLFVPILFLLFVLILPEYQRSFFLKSICFSLGLVLLTAGTIFYLIKKQSGNLFKSIIILAAYVIVFIFQFQSTTLDAFIPAGRNIRAIEFSSWDSPQTLIWDLSSNTVTYPYSGDSFTVENNDKALDKIKSIVLRNYWLPGNMKKDIIFDLNIILDDYSYISVYRESNGVAIYSRIGGGLTISHWMVFDDISSVLPEDVLSALE